MKPRIDKLAVSDAAWLKAVSREGIIRPLTARAHLSPSELSAACREVGLGRARFHELLIRPWRIVT